MHYKNIFIGMVSGFGLLWNALFGNFQPQILGADLPMLQQLVATTSPYVAITTRGNQSIYVPFSSVTSYTIGLLGNKACNGANALGTDARGNVICDPDVGGAGGGGNFSGTTVRTGGVFYGLDPTITDHTATSNRYLYFDWNSNELYTQNASSITATSTYLNVALSGILKGNYPANVGTAINGTDFTLVTARDCSGSGHLVSIAANGTSACAADPVVSWGAVSGDTNVATYLNGSGTIPQIAYTGFSNSQVVTVDAVGNLITSGTVSVALGGTGANSITSGNLIQGNGNGAFTATSALGENLINTAWTKIADASSTQRLANMTGYANYILGTDGTNNIWQNTVSSVAATSLKAFIGNQNYLQIATNWLDGGANALKVGGNASFSGTIFQGLATSTNLWYTGSTVPFFAKANDSRGMEMQIQNMSSIGDSGFVTYNDKGTTTNNFFSAGINGSQYVDTTNYPISHALGAYLLSSNDAGELVIGVSGTNATANRITFSAGYNFATSSIVGYFQATSTATGANFVVLNNAQFNSASSNTFAINGLNGILHANGSNAITVTSTLSWDHGGTGVQSCAAGSSLVSNGSSFVCQSLGSVSGWKVVSSNAIGPTFASSVIVSASSSFGFISASTIRIMSILSTTGTGLHVGSMENNGGGIEAESSVTSSGLFAQIRNYTSQAIVFFNPLGQLVSDGIKDALGMLFDSNGNLDTIYKNVSFRQPKLVNDYSGVTATGTMHSTMTPGVPLFFNLFDNQWEVASSTIVSTVPASALSVGYTAAGAVGTILKQGYFAYPSTAFSASSVRAVFVSNNLATSTPTQIPPASMSGTVYAQRVGTIEGNDINGADILWFNFDLTDVQ